MSEPEEVENVEEEVVVPGAFEARQKRLEEIASASEDERVKGGEFELEAPDSESVVAEEPGGDEVEPAKVKIKVNGREIELTQEELIARAQKVESADRYLEDAKKSFKVATEAPPSHVDVEPKDDPASVDEARALARALQMGDEEEATKAVLRLRARPSEVTPDVVASTVDNRIALRRQVETVEAEHKDLLSHKALGPIFRQKLAELGRASPETPLSDGYQQVAESIRADFGAMLKPASTKLERKAAAPQVPAAGSRQSVPPDEDAEVPVSETIRRMAEANHRRYI